jgi:hypothetical protein
MIESMERRRSRDVRRMLLAAAVATLLCAVGTVLVFVAAVPGFALLFIGFGVFALVPFLASGPAGPAERDVERQHTDVKRHRTADDNGSAHELKRASLGGRPRPR